METRLTDTLCTRCGLRCDGTLFAEVELAHRAEERAHEHISQALASIAEMRSLLNRLGRGDARLPLRERCAEALMDAGAAAERTRLRRAMHALERQILAVFLEGRGPKD
jgi:hypothetical protein